MATPRPYGRGPYGASVYATYRTYEIGGLSQVAFGAEAATLIRTWQQPTQMCSAGAWQQTPDCNSGTWTPADLELAA
jgi:hypothetical protein